MQIKLLTFVRRLNHDMTLAQKYLLSIICMVVIPLIILSLIFYSKLQAILEHELGSLHNQVVEQYIDNINYKFEIYQNMLETIAANATVQDIFSRQDTIKRDETIEVSRSFSREIDSLLNARSPSEIYGIMLYAMNEEFPSDGKNIGSIGAVKDEAWYQEVIGQKKYNSCFFSTTPGMKIEILSITRAITNLTGKDGGGILGIVKVEMNAANFFAGDRKWAEKGIKHVIVMNPAGELSYGAGSPESADDYRAWMKDLADQGQAGGALKTATINGSKEMLILKSIDWYGWQMLFVFPYDELRGKVLDIGIFILVILLVMLIVLLGLSILLSRLFSKRIGLLVRKMKSVETGNLDNKILIEGKDEVGVLDHNFNSMIDKLKTLISENYIQRIGKREAELSALQMQINPHFLYNTLESISSIASVYECSEICVISQKLGDMFRYSISKGKGEFVCLRDELQHIENYIKIQKIRFEERFDAVFRVPENLLDYRVVKFILQPIVENALYHGLDDKKGKGLLEIAAAIEAGRLILTVRDDGKGMPEEQVAYLNKAINEKENYNYDGFQGSIGIRNVNSRIRLTCGDDYGLTVISGPGDGTRVVISLPALIASQEEPCSTS